jgi:hypothetical protein
MEPTTETLLTLVTEKAFGNPAITHHINGYLKGLRKGAAEIINTQLQVRLRMSYWWRERIEALDFHDLGQLGIAMLEFQTLQDLDKWLKKRERAAARRAKH